MTKNNSVKTVDRVAIGTDASSTETHFTVRSRGFARKPGAIEHGQVESAVYAYIQALRTLGHTHINSHDIAKGLGLPRSVVENVLKRLTEKGVRLAE